MAAVAALAAAAPGGPGKCGNARGVSMGRRLRRQRLGRLSSGVWGLIGLTHPMSKQQQAPPSPSEVELASWESRERCVDGWIDVWARGVESVHGPVKLVADPRGAWSIDWQAMQCNAMQSKAKQSTPLDSSASASSLLLAPYRARRRTTHPWARNRRIDPFSTAAHACATRRAHRNHPLASWFTVANHKSKCVHSSSRAQGKPLHQASQARRRRRHHHPHQPHIIASHTSMHAMPSPQQQQHSHRRPRPTTMRLSTLLILGLVLLVLAALPAGRAQGQVRCRDLAGA